jgi:polyisoprenoid-binding protein YceI
MNQMTAPTTTTTGVTTWAIDGAHSIAEFSVKHMMVAKAKGRFGAFDGSIQWDQANPANSSVEITIDVASIDTNESQRDAHLRSDDFFNAEQYPNAVFKSTRIEPVGDQEFKVYGDLTIRDQTHPIVLDVELEGQIVDPYGLHRAGFEAETEISRKQFGLSWNALLETGGAVVADRVKLTFHIEATQQQG